MPEAFARITRFIKENGAVPAIQLAHAGRKASTPRPGMAVAGLILPNGGWEPIAPCRGGVFRYLSDAARDDDG